NWTFRAANSENIHDSDRLQSQDFRSGGKGQGPARGRAHRDVQDPDRRPEGQAPPDLRGQAQRPREGQEDRQGGRGQEGRQGRQEGRQGGQGQEGGHQGQEVRRQER